MSQQWKIKLPLLRKPSTRHRSVPASYGESRLRQKCLGTTAMATVMEARYHPAGESRYKSPQTLPFLWGDTSLLDAPRCPCNCDSGGGWNSPFSAAWFQVPSVSELSLERHFSGGSAKGYNSPCLLGCSNLSYFGFLQGKHFVGKSASMHLHW